MDNRTYSTDSSWNPPYGIAVQIIVWLMVVVISFETIIGNAMVVIAYNIERNIGKKVSNRYIVSLAISDLIIGIEGFPLFTTYVLNGERWPLGQLACKTWLFLDYTLCLVSILTVLLITTDRYLSVCHMVMYLKWQSSTKAEMLIILSWFIPAVIFGVIMYGWDTITGMESMTTAECSAPFLSNPYVNMGMYVVYYWTTLVAMLILYKDIHQAAKSLEKKAEAKEQRHMALILSQRLGTQVGVTLMLHSHVNKEERKHHRSNSEFSSLKTNLEVRTAKNISSVSTTTTNERVLSSIFAPLSANLGRRHRRTVAERRARKAFRTITFIVGCFAILWSPYYIVATIYGFCKGECIPTFVYNLSYYMCYLNSSSNPFVYALANRQFRIAFVRMFKGDFNKNV
ncbi:unnamed protein product [Angiostrongylus costaricensis]|uniref:G_PROTEIN_RECEP_F1_2 domain-containing protein n=1 Tax=Angiostrongylus costaricensis TaxID=334426 RepID=A0A158PKF2_ANGCS|nr:unnamed protein product [Angiostrongylus costaricensis]